MHRRGPRQHNPMWTLVQRFFNSKPHEYRTQKAILGLPVGFLFGICIYYAVVQRLLLPKNLEIVLGIYFIAICTAGFAVSTQVRCVSFLIIPTFFGKTGRNYIGTIALSYVLAGPVANIMLNGKEVTRSVTCSGELTANLTKARMKLKLMPLYDIMMDLKEQGKNINNITKKIKKGFKPVEMEVRRETDVESIKERAKSVDGNKRVGFIENKYRTSNEDNEDEKVQKQFQKKLDYQCEDVFSIGVQGCKKVFKETYAACRRKVKVIGKVVCLPLKLSVLCNLVSTLPGTTGMNCRSDDVVDGGFGEMFTTAEQAARDMGKNFKVNMQFKVVNIREKLDRLTPEDIALRIQHEFQWRQKIMDFVTVLFKRILAFMFVFMISAAFTYNAKYTSDIEYDNLYITKYFRHIDERRFYRNKTILLPLKKLESTTYIFPTSIKMSADERGALVNGTLTTIFTGIAYGMIIFIDHAIYAILDAINKSSRIDYVQRGTHHIELIVTGEGMMGRMVKDLVKGLNTTHNLNQQASNYQCLPNPFKTDNTYLVIILCVLILRWFLNITESYGLRLRRVIAGFFYRKREKRRVLHLYNEMLKKRKGYLKHLHHVIKRRAKEQMLMQNASLTMALLRSFPRACACLKRLGKGRKRCIACESRANKTFVHCDTPGCEFVYCRDCWRELGMCYACRGEADWSSESESDYDF